MVGVWAVCANPLRTTFPSLTHESSAPASLLSHGGLVTNIVGGYKGQYSIISARLNSIIWATFARSAAWRVRPMDPA